MDRISSTRLWGGSGYVKTAILNFSQRRLRRCGGGRGGKRGKLAILGRRWGLCSHCCPFFAEKGEAMLSHRGSWIHGVGGKKKGERGDHYQLAKSAFLLLSTRLKGRKGAAGSLAQRGERSANLEGTGCHRRNQRERGEKHRSRGKIWCTKLEKGEEEGRR